MKTGRLGLPPVEVAEPMDAATVEGIARRIVGEDHKETFVTKRGAYKMLASDNRSVLAYESGSRGTFTLPDAAPPNWHATVVQTGSARVTLVADDGSSIKASGDAQPRTTMRGEALFVVRTDGGSWVVLPYGWTDKGVVNVGLL